MRLILTLRGTSVIDLELAWPRRPDPQPEGPALRSGGTHLAHTELASYQDEPFGFSTRGDSR